MPRHELVLSPRLAAQLALSLDADCRCRASRSARNGAAQAAGLTVAEIKAARRGLSFDVRDAAALSLARAIDHDPTLAGLHRQRAERAGLPASVTIAVEQFTRDFVACRNCVSHQVCALA